MLGFVKRLLVAGVVVAGVALGAGAAAAPAQAAVGVGVGVDVKVTVTPGAFCAKAQLGLTGLSATGHVYVCLSVDGGVPRWCPVPVVVPTPGATLPSVVPTGGATASVTATATVDVPVPAVSATVEVPPVAVSPSAAVVVVPSGSADAEVITPVSDSASLPVTGAHTAFLVSGGAAALFVGMGLVLLVRRRRGVRFMP